jgi:hypothetical protein
MHFTQQIVSLAALAACASAHGVVTKITGANGVSMPGLTIQDGTPRDCTSNGCGSQADTAIIRDRDIASGKATPLGRTQGNGPVDASVMIAAFMGAGAAPPANQGAASSVGVEDNIKQRRQLLAGLLGGGGKGAAKGAKTTGPPEAGVAAAVGAGASTGLPTCADDGTVTFTMRQINQDGAGPFTADVDGTSGGTAEAAMQKATVTTNAPGLGFGGLSLATNTDFEMKVQMPAGMTCDATVAGTPNVCVMRVRNAAAAGPFGGSVAFTQGTASRKRAIAYKLKKRMELNRSN